MFGKLKTICRSVKSIDEEKLINGLLQSDSIKAQVIDLNQYQLYEQGLLADGSSTGSYAMNTIYGTHEYEGKIAKGQRYDHVTLNDTGAFYKSMEVKAVPEGIQIDADYVKGGHDLRDIYGEAIAGLTSESLSQIRPEIREGMIQRVKEKMYGKATVAA